MDKGGGSLKEEKKLGVGCRGWIRKILSVNIRYGRNKNTQARFDPKLFYPKKRVNLDKI